MKKLTRKLKRIVPKPFYRWHLIHAHVPTRVRLEASTVCQLRCKSCSFQNGQHRNLGRGFLTFENFKQFVDENPSIQEIELSNKGEIFLNPELVEMMRYAHEKGVKLTCRNGSNFNTVSEEQMRTMVESGFLWITLSIDGASQETYSKYRIGGDFETVIANVRHLQEIKEEMHSELPRLEWQYVLNEYNELDAGKAKAMAKEMAIPIRFKLNWDPGYQPKNIDYLKKKTGLDALTRAEYTEKNGAHPFGGICKQIFEKPQINWDGRLLGCATRQYAPFDVNVFEVGFKKALFSPKYIEAKRCLLTAHPDPQRYSGCPCIDCGNRMIREQHGVALDI